MKNMIHNKPGKFATEHLECCEHPECEFCVDSTCCFGMRGLGCVILDPDLLRRTDKISSVLIAANRAFYDNGILDSGSPQTLKGIERGIIDMLKFQTW